MVLSGSGGNEHNSLGKRKIRMMTMKKRDEESNKNEK